MLRCVVLDACLVKDGIRDAMSRNQGKTSRMGENSLLLAYNRLIKPSSYRCGRCQWLDLDCKAPELFKASKAGSHRNSILAHQGCNSVSTCIRTSTTTETFEVEVSNSDFIENTNEDGIPAVDKSSHDLLKGIRARSTTDPSIITTVNWPASRMER